jgi:hypothetical protein
MADILASSTPAVGAAYRDDTICVETAARTTPSAPWPQDR